MATAVAGTAGAAPLIAIVVTGRTRCAAALLGFLFSFWLRAGAIIAARLVTAGVVATRRFLPRLAAALIGFALAWLARSRCFNLGLWRGFGIAFVATEQFGEAADKAPNNAGLLAGHRCCFGRWSCSGRLLFRLQRCRGGSVVGDTLDGGFGALSGRHEAGCRLFAYFGVGGELKAR